MPVGLVRPITLYPFPEQAVREAAVKAGNTLVVEMNTGQMVDDVRLACDGESRVFFKGYPGGHVPTPEDILAEIDNILNRGGLKACQL
jgi:2-oxoglutarate/2-oxoacid ferredoxin oxidoreductase subunit alpha